MSDLFVTTNNNRCQGWTNPNNIVFGPQINNLTSYYSPAGSTTLVSINGANFFSYSSISFGTYNPTVYFINSNLLQFYVPATLNAGTYTIQVFNGSFGSNIVNYIIDNASGYWLLNSNGSISNTNISFNSNTYGSNLVALGSLSRGVPINVNETMSPYTVPSNVNWIVCYNKNTNSSITIVMPTGSQYIGREITIKNVINGIYNIPPLVLALENYIVPFNQLSPSNGGTSSNQILAPNSDDLCQWATLVYDGTYWITIQKQIGN